MKVIKKLLWKLSPSYSDEMIKFFDLRAFFQAHQEIAPLHFNHAIGEHAFAMLSVFGLLDAKTTNPVFDRMFPEDICLGDIPPENFRELCVFNTGEQPDILQACLLYRHPDPKKSKICFISLHKDPAPPLHNKWSVSFRFEYDGRCMSGYGLPCFEIDQAADFIPEKIGDLCFLKNNFSKTQTVIYLPLQDAAGKTLPLVINWPNGKIIPFQALKNNFPPVRTTDGFIL